MRTIPAVASLQAAPVVGVASGQRIPTVVTPSGLKITPVPNTVVSGRTTVLFPSQTQQSQSPGLIRAANVVTTSAKPQVFFKLYNCSIRLLFKG